jgi:DNA repair exonuclease SbcCD ATPase subunit
MGGRRDDWAVPLLCQIQGFAKMEEMTKAIEDVNSVAENLRELHEKITQYGNAAERLREMGEVLKKLGESVGEIQEAFSAALDNTRQLQNDAKELVQRIESSDVEASTKDLSIKLDSISTKLDNNQSTQKENAQGISDIATSIKKLSDRFDGISALLENDQSIQRENTRALNDLKNMLAKNEQAVITTIETLSKVSGAVSSVHTEIKKQRTEFGRLNASLRDDLLEAIKKKKGRIFG